MRTNPSAAEKVAGTTSMRNDRELRVLVLALLIVLAIVAGVIGVLYLWIGGRFYG